VVPFGCLHVPVQVLVIETLPAGSMPWTANFHASRRVTAPRVAFVTAAPSWLPIIDTPMPPVLNPTACAPMTARSMPP
jgi:hypothetical protein